MRFVFMLLVLAAPLRGADLTLAFQPRWNGEALPIPSAQVASARGEQLRLTRLSALVSGVALRRADGTTVRLDGQYGFIDAGSGRLEFTLSGVPEGDYEGVEFQVGVPATVNHADPGQWPAGHALNPLVNALHWGWQGGYVFLALEGRWSPPGADTERGFSHHIATDAHFMPVGFVSNFQVRARTRIQLALDVGRVLRDVALVAEGATESTHSAAGDALADMIATATTRAWFWLGASFDAKPSEAFAAAAASTSDATARGAGTPVAFSVPAGFPQPMLPADNRLTAEGIALGEFLFHDPRLSSTGSQSCASCHDPAAAFSDTVAFSIGAEGEPGARNTMPLFNLAWSPAYAWDGTQPRIRDQARAAWTNPVEMNGDPAEATRRLADDPGARGLFQQAFGDDSVTSDRVTLALEQYLLTLVAADSKFDRAQRGEVEMTSEEARGFMLFNSEYDPRRERYGADCFHCHGGQLFTDFGYRNNGLRLEKRDSGRFAASLLESDRGKFKTPSLRNVALTAPYMHDGSVGTLEEIVAHYDHGVQRTSNLDPNLAKHPAEGLRLSEDDQKAVVAFLRMLTDVD